MPVLLMRHLTATQAYEMPECNGLEGSSFVQTEKKPKPRATSREPLPGRHRSFRVCKYKP